MPKGDSSYAPPRTIVRRLAISFVVAAVVFGLSMWTLASDVLSAPTDRSTRIFEALLRLASNAAVLTLLVTAIFLCLFSLDLLRGKYRR